MIQVSYVPEYEVILTRRCAFTCSYCDYPNMPTPLPPSLKEFRSHLRTAQRIGARQITIAAGEGIDQMPEIENTCRYYGYNGWYHYLAGLCHATLEARGVRPLFPVLQVGPIPYRELLMLRPYVAGVKLLLDTADPGVSQRVHEFAPQKNATLRALALNDLGRAGIPVLTGTRVGLGENPKSWIAAVKSINDIQRKYGNIHSFAVVPFVPKALSADASRPPIADEAYTNALRTIRKHLDSDIILVAEVYERIALAPEAVVSGAFDLGSVRLASNETIDVDMRSSVNNLRELLDKISVNLTERLPLAESFMKVNQIPSAVAHNVYRYNHMLYVEKDHKSTPPEGNSIVFSAAP